MKHIIEVEQFFYPTSQMFYFMYFYTRNSIFVCQKSLVRYQGLFMYLQELSLTNLIVTRKIITVGVVPKFFLEDPRGFCGKRIFWGNTFSGEIHFFRNAVLENAFFFPRGSSRFLEVCVGNAFFSEIHFLENAIMENSFFLI